MSAALTQRAQIVLGCAAGDDFVTHYNKHCRLFVWTATADSVLEKLERLTSRISGTGHL
jgi:hypothetical protein